MQKRSFKIGFTLGIFLFGFCSISEARLPLFSKGYAELKNNNLLNLKLPILQLDTVKPRKNRDSINQVKKVVLKGENDNGHYMPALDGANIYAGKKSESITLDSLTINAAANTTRQIFAKIPGLNIWENDGAGLQLGIGGRGLSPNRVSNFNTRQNGYDISADALGYPESYYTPPAEMIERIEILRGASSLQYGTQFGGLINFKLKTGPPDKKFQFNTAQTVGSFGFLNHTSSIGGTLKKWNYFALYQNKSAQGWRDNSGFESQTIFANVAYQFNENIEVKLDYTRLTYLAQQAGGLTDNQFQENPRQSFRNRNWFSINWNIVGLTTDIKLNKNTKLNWRNFALLAGRNALGNLSPVNRADAMQNRDFLNDKYLNFGSELRLVKQYKIKGLRQVLLTGLRYYQGKTERRQGEADNTNLPNFNYLSPENLEGSDFLFPSRNMAFFAENIFYLGSRLSIIPGIRIEQIQTASAGYYRQISRDLAGNIILDQRINEAQISNRSFIIGGLGASYKTKNNLEWYANISQNYRAVNFNDLRVNNPSLRVDPNLKDEKGFTADMGFRGNWKKVLQFDVSGFLLQYNNRIGSVLQVDSQLFNLYRFRTNIAASNSYGLEFFGEWDVLKTLQKGTSKVSLKWFVNTALIDARYTRSQEKAFENKKVEYVPNQIIRTGFNLGYKKLRFSLQHSYTSAQFTEATNTIATPTGIDGLIPSYHVTDFNATYQWKKFGFQLAINNLLNQNYFTRRAAGYPGPGIIPSDGRSFFLTVNWKL